MQEIKLKKCIYFCTGPGYTYTSRSLIYILTILFSFIIAATHKVYKKISKELELENQKTYRGSIRVWHVSTPPVIVVGF